MPVLLPEQSGREGADEGAYYTRVLLDFNLLDGSALGVSAADISLLLQIIKQHRLIGVILFPSLGIRDFRRPSSHCSLLRSGY